MHYKILLVSALPMEHKIIKKQVKNLSLPGLHIDFLMTGVGAMNLVYELTKFLTKNDKPDLVVNIWICGRRSKKNHDFVQFAVAENNHWKEEVFPIYKKILPLVSAISSEKIISDSHDLREFDYVDMESFALSFVVKKFDIPFWVLKASCDIVGENSLKVSMKEVENSLRTFPYKNIFLDLQDRCKKNISQKPDLEKYKRHFSLSVAEFEIFKKLYYKHKAFQKDVEDFLKKNWEIDKKDLLDRMDFQHTKK